MIETHVSTTPSKLINQLKNLRMKSTKTFDVIKLENFFHAMNMLNQTGSAMFPELDVLRSLWEAFYKRTQSFWLLKRILAHLKPSLTLSLGLSHLRVPFIL